MEKMKNSSRVRGENTVVKITTKWSLITLDHTEFAIYVYQNYYMYVFFKSI